MNKIGVVISGGYISPKLDIKNFVQDKVVVCADSGYVYALNNCIKPCAVLGDFDSLPENVDLNEKSFEVLRFKVEKDQSDTQLCIDYLADLGVAEIYVFGALGGNRFEHTVANLQLLEYGIKKGIRICIKEENTEVFLISNETVKIKGNKDDYLSVFALHRAENICYKGLKYGLENGCIESYLPYGLSNVMLEDSAEISVEKGELLIIHTGGEGIE